MGPGRIGGVEALMRWRHPERGTVPRAVHPGAEDTGPSSRSGEWVLRAACRAAARLARQAGHPPITVGVTCPRRLPQADLVSGSWPASRDGD